MQYNNLEECCSTLAASKGPRTLAAHDKCQNTCPVWFLVVSWHVSLQVDACHPINIHRLPISQRHCASTLRSKSCYHVRSLDAHVLFIMQRLLFRLHAALRVCYRLLMTQRHSTRTVCMAPCAHCDITGGCTQHLHLQWHARYCADLPSKLFISLKDSCH